jgi:hypothetical protein
MLLLCVAQASLSWSATLREQAVLMTDAAKKNQRQTCRKASLREQQK